MEKIVNEKECLIVYRGELEELREQLVYLVENHYSFKGMVSVDEIKNFLSKELYKTEKESLMFNSEEIRYGPNGDSNESKFNYIKHFSNLADEKFIEKYGKKSLEVRIRD